MSSFISGSDDFTTSMPYVVASMGGNTISGGTIQQATIILIDKSYKFTTYCRMRIKNDANTFITADRDSYDLIFFEGV